MVYSARRLKFECIMISNDCNNRLCSLLLLAPAVKRTISDDMLSGTLVGSESLGSSDARHDHLATNRRFLVSRS